MKRILYCFCIISLSFSLGLTAQTREVQNFNQNWKFALGHAYDFNKDYGTGTGHFSYYAKAGFGDGAAAQNFDDRMWQDVTIPHDWCVSLPFVENGSTSHGSKAIGRNFPENSVGWYRKTFTIPENWYGSKISIEFDGIYRNSRVWVNGFYLGEEHSGYNTFSYDLTEYLNYGGENVIAVRADATYEEGWYYEGAGIYRNVRLVKTNPLHIAPSGLFITTDSIFAGNKEALLTLRTTISNETNQPQSFTIHHTICNPQGLQVQEVSSDVTLKPFTSEQFFKTNVSITQPQLWEVWDMGTPNLYTVKTEILSNGTTVDGLENTFGIRTLRFDANKGCFLNGHPIKIRGVCLHQDHAGVGVAVTPELQQFRVEKMIGMGCNAIRSSHNPTAPEFLDACDRLGVLVLPEIRLMGINREHQYTIEQLITRDRNHPCVFMWGLGNEEWYIEGNERGARITRNMENFARMLDSSRAFTIAPSGGWDNGISKASEVGGINYIKHGDVEGHHKLYPNQPIIGTEESNTVRTRGIYETNNEKCWLAATNLYDDGMEGGWKFYSERDWAMGLFFWTGLDYRGEPTPYVWPAVVSQFGIADLCGFEKDNFYYLASWWKKEPIVHIATNWNYSKQGEEKNITVFSNCQQVELMLNGKSQGKKNMEKNGHLEWNIPFMPGTLQANGYDANGKIIAKATVSTPDVPVKVELMPYHKQVAEQDVAIVTVQTRDKKGNVVSTANNLVHFSVQGHGTIVGVGNGDPSSHDAEVFLDENSTVPITDLREITVTDIHNRPEVAAGYNYSSWIPAFSQEPADWLEYTDTLKVTRGVFQIDNLAATTKVTLFAKSILDNQSIYVNGHLLKADASKDQQIPAIVIPNSYLKQGKNEYAVTGKKLHRPNQWDQPNHDPGLVQIIDKAPEPTRTLFNGFAQVLVKVTGKGPVTIKATADGIKNPAQIVINSNK